MEITTFDRISSQQSTKIFKTLCQGHVINKLKLNPHTVQYEENPLYTSLFTEQIHFTSLYQHIGFELIHEPLGDFFFVRNIDYSCVDEADDNALKIQAMLIVIGHHYASKGQNLELLTDVNFGISNDDFIALRKNSLYENIITSTSLACIPTGMAFLIKRGFAFKSGADSFVLSQAGMLFLERLQESNSNELVEDAVETLPSEVQLSD